MRNEERDDRIDAGVNGTPIIISCLPSSSYQGTLRIYAINTRFILLLYRLNIWYFHINTRCDNFRSGSLKGYHIRPLFTRSGYILIIPLVHPILES